MQQTYTMTGSQSVVFQRQPSGALEWAYYGAIYDQFKVNGMRVFMTLPKYQTPNGPAGIGLFTIYPEAIAWCYDNDSITQPASFQAVLGYSNLQITPADGVVTYSCPKLPQGAAYGAAVGGYINATEWSDVASPGALAGCVTAWSTKLTTAPSAAFSVICVVEYDVTFKGKRN